MRSWRTCSTKRTPVHQVGLIAGRDALLAMWNTSCCTKRTPVHQVGLIAGRDALAAK